MNRRTLFLVAALAAILPAVALAATGQATTPPDQMSNFALWGIIGGAALTYVSALVNRVHWPDHLRFATFFVFSLIYAAADAYFARTLNFHDWVRAALVVIASGIVFYNLNRGAIKSFEAATS